MEPLFTGEYPESIQKLRDAPTPPSGLQGACDFIVYSYETTGLVTWMDGLYNVTLADDYWRFGAIDFCISNPNLFLNRLLDSYLTLVEMTPFQSENFFKLRASQYSNDWTGQQGGKYGQRFIQNGLRDFINEYVDASIPAYIKTRWTTSSHDQIKTKSGKLMYFSNIPSYVRRSAPSGWSSSLYRPMRISEQMTTGRHAPLYVT